MNGCGEQTISSRFKTIAIEAGLTVVAFQGGVLFATLLAKELFGLARSKSMISRPCVASPVIAVWIDGPILRRAIDDVLGVGMSERRIGYSSIHAVAYLFRPGAIIDRLDLRRPIYLSSSFWGGHFGRKAALKQWVLRLLVNPGDPARGDTRQ